MNFAVSFPTRRWVMLATLAAAMFPAPLVLRADAEPDRPRAPSVRLDSSAALTDFSLGRLEIHSSALRSQRIQLEFPDRPARIAVLDRTETHAVEGFVWVGHLDGEPLSRVCLATSGPTVAGLIDRSAYQPGDIWQLLPGADGGHSLIQSPRLTADFTCSVPNLPTTGHRQAQTAAVSIGHTTTADVYANSGARPKVLDLLVVYSPAARSRFTQAGLTAMILQAVADANTTFASSYTGVMVKLVGLQEVAHVESSSANINTVLGRMVVPGDGYLDTVPGLRDRYGADLVTLISEDTGAAGVAYIPYMGGVFHPEHAYNVVNDSSLIGGAFTHELGHNLGCQHDRGHAGNPDQNATPYAYGYQSCANDALGFRDIMAYECVSGGTSQWLPYFSNPWLSYLGRPLGIDYAVNPANACDNARNIRENAPSIARFRNSLQPQPAALIQLTATSSSFNQVSLTWSTPDSASAGVEIRKSTDGGTTWAPAAFVTAGVTSWIDRSLTPSTTYWYQVQAFNSAGVGGSSPTASAITLSTPSPPASPIHLTVQSLSPSRLDLSWTDAATNEDGYRIERSTDGGAYVPQATLGWDSTGYNDGVGLQAGHSYAYRVTAFNSAGTSAPATALFQYDSPPSGPITLSFLPLSTSSVQVNWIDTANNETGFIVEVSLNGINFQTLATRSSNQTNIVVTGLVAGTPYSYRIWARNLAGLSTSAATGRLVWGQVPNSPTGLTIQSVVPGQITLSWTDASNTETGFVVERAVGTATSASTFSSVATPAANVVTSLDSTVSPGTRYTYRLRSVNAIGVSAPSPTVVVTTLPLAPSAPTALMATATSSTQITLGWTDTAANETGFAIERATTPATGTTAGTYSQIATSGLNSLKYLDNTSAAGTTYSYRMRAYNPGGYSAYTAAVNVTTPPATPSALVAVVKGPAQINLSWTDRSSNETGFLVERSSSGGTFSRLTVTAPNTTQYVDATPSPSTSYSYRVSAIAGSLISSSNPFVTLTTPPPPPLAPDALTATATSSSAIALTWNDNASNETSYSVERSVGGGAFTIRGTLGANVKSFQDTLASAGTTYTYRVRAANAGGYSNYSPTATVTTPTSTAVTVPVAPTGLTAKAISSSQVHLTWTDKSNNESGFKVEMLYLGNWVALTNLAANVNSCTVSALLSRTSYTFRISAFNTAGTSSASMATITTP